ncbi:Glutamine synthetase adenylyl-L-tyrosine phosphorylase / Glutamine synthetase adenylyl transferase [Candidatus Methylobacter favarea]|uniref:Bifunctional glutamine synthetase adenylyltransferase/adenylyl-removing enzyme n=1 Tax=Candidatus Methylobacter favarea TaxID=2707345 RepID=A0A8S0YAL7_9GAMM|nr:bifunctional [glutamate--ammonia ligase]-adenylyl-L-tyrosine phosphorylase/[glutamate--ammonia-ligase] adenylyltransferase [Candidatus Methylobacter favarea]CAA9892177.1 Glutamine synthetase adenylyl-L-tyrosine phosphorylase / Glutamine synthetase adenylyl transferase [Candidatus Methylobacter favarea]
MSIFLHGHYVSLMDNLESELAALYPGQREIVEASLKKWADYISGLDFKDLKTQKFTASIVKVWGCSLFVAESCSRKPELLVDLVVSGDLAAIYSDTCYHDKLALLAINSEADLMAKLRHFRRREMIRIAWRDLAGWAPLTETLLDLSGLADACIQYALAFLYRQACDKRGVPLLSNGRPQQIIVLGMGKLGACELNYSSDVDLIFAYAEEGVLADRKATSYGEFFTRLCQSLVKVLDETTVDGFVFRTDIRLRPFGDSGPIIMTFDGMEKYYQTQAREWERYAMIKARQVAGDFDTGAKLMVMLKSFVYRRYLDYGAFEELRALKVQITLELRRKDRLENIKLGPGGIREIEFIGQAFQLIRGGKDKALQKRGILEVLQILGQSGLLSETEAEQLRQSYCFLRRIENHIQQYQDKQTHDLPVQPAVQHILAYSLDYPDWHGFKHELDKVRSYVHEVFGLVFSLSRQEVAPRLSQKIWACIADEAELIANLKACNFQEPEEILAAIKGFKNSSATRRLTAKGAAVLDRLMPQLIEAVQQVDNREETLKRLLGLFEAVAGRNVYLSLLSENPDALSQLIRLSSASPWVSDYLAHYPVLFDELLDTRTLYEPLKKNDLDAQLKILLSQIDRQDVEQLMIALRQFKQLNVLRVAAADIMGVIPVMVVSDYLTYIAENIVSHSVERAWQMLAETHGYPPDSDNNAIGFAVIGFGKLGGIELGYGSDLDLVFLYDCKDGHALTEGPKPVSCSRFYGKLGQKVRHILDTRMLSGVLYEVDMRLRPSGESGLLVNHINSYEEYLKNQAWTWEHQALVRGRFIAGDPLLKAQFEAIRRKILSVPRDSAQLKKEVREMREKMRKALDLTGAEKFDLKQSKGGIADIEFIVQFGVLDQASKNKALTTYTDNIRLLDGLREHGFISATNADTLKTAYCAYRDYGHKLVLQGDRAVIDESEVAEMRTQVEQIWRDYME